MALIVKHRDDFGVLLDNLKLNGMGIEIGVNEGTYSDVLLSKTRLQKIYFVDPWKEFISNEQKDNAYYGSQKTLDDRYKMVVEKLKKYGERVAILRKDSVEALQDFSNDYFDFIYIDAVHTYEYVKKDMNSWYPKLKHGGVFAGHDYAKDTISSLGVYGVKSAVDEFCQERNIKMSLTGGSRRCPPSWYFIKV